MNYTDLKNERIKKIMLDDILAGKSNSKIIKECIGAFSISQPQAYNLIREANAEIMKYTISNMEEITPLHTGRYEYMYSVAYEMGYRLLAKKCLKAKEKLLMLHTQYNKIKVSNNFNAGETSSIFDASRLSKKEQERFNELSQKVLFIKK